MRHKGTNKEETHRKILAAVGQGFRQHGYAGIGVDGLAKTAGVTSGAFYSHFGSKDGAFETALSAGLDEVIEAVPQFQREHGAGWVKAFVEYYMGKSHRKDLACGCAMATLTTEVVRSDAPLHAKYEQKMKLIASLISEGLAESSKQNRIDRAWSMLAVLTGGINIARAMKAAKVSDEVAAAIQDAAIQAAGPTKVI